MTLDEIKAAIDAGKTVHWANEGYVVHKDDLGEYLITFRPNGSTVGLTDRAGTKLNEDSRLFFVARFDLGITVHCEDCHSTDVVNTAWASWNSELQVWETTEMGDRAYCNRCDASAHLIAKPLRDYGAGRVLEASAPVPSARIAATVGD